MTHPLKRSNDQESRLKSRILYFDQKSVLDKRLEIKIIKTADLRDDFILFLKIDSIFKNFNQWQK